MHIRKGEKFMAIWKKEKWCRNGFEKFSLTYFFDDSTPKGMEELKDQLAKLAKLL